MPYDREGAVQYVKSHAYSHYIKGKCGHCAAAVARAIREGGHIQMGNDDAWHLGRDLQAAGFQPVTDGSLQAGDVEVMQPVPGHSVGHTAMYDGSDWVSDYDQGPGWDGTKGDAFTHNLAQANRVVYRYTGVQSVTHAGSQLTTTANHNVYVGHKRRKMSHKHARHTRGKVVQGSQTVFVGVERYAVARVGDSTDDGTAIATGEETIGVG